MRSSLFAGVGMLAIVGLLAPSAVAHAQDAADSRETDVTFTVLGLEGDLEISVALGNATLGLSGTNNERAQGSLGTVSVRDRRDGNGRQWTASVQSTDFVNEDSVIPASEVEYRVSGLVGGTAATRTNYMAAWTPIDEASAAVSRNSINIIDATSTWTPGLRVNFTGVGSDSGPGVVAGQYSGTVTTSVI